MEFVDAPARRPLLATNIEPDEISSASYDIGVFVEANGPRASFVERELQPRLRLRVAVPRGGKTTDADIYNGLRRAAPKSGVIRVLVDYSDMSPAEYAAVFNWAELASPHGAEIDMVYAESDYDKAHPPLMIDSILAVPGCEGNPVLGRQTVGLFGLGYDGPVALGVLDRLEPDVVFAVVANPGSTEDAAERASRFNKPFLENHADVRVDLPISHVATTVRYMQELVAPYIGAANVVAVPLGPKPHALAAQILSRSYPRDIACLYVTGRRVEGVTAIPTGRFVTTRVSYRNGSLD